MFRIVCDPSSGSVECSSQLVITGTHTAGSKLRCQTPTTHTKISQVISVKLVQDSLMMDRRRSETCESDF